MTIKALLVTVSLGFWSLLLYAQIEKDENAYKYPSDMLVRKKLERWQGLKFGLFMHWGPYSQRGIVESWTLSPEDYAFCKRTGPDSADYYAYTKSYEQLQQTFNPTQFNPEKWAAAAAKAGMKYMVFTTKHHDGFCMFDTKYTDYKITSTHCAFSANPRSNITREIFNAFRAANFMVGAYYSKPDWHSDDFWWRYFPPKDRHVNYDITKYPERWQRFCDFTANQINELTTNYGNVDLLWFDGDWVKMNMLPVAAKARQHQPGMIIVERHGAPELVDYLTPEQKVPDHYIATPWETCMTMGDSWSYIFNENYKPARQLVQTLIDVVAKNGNLLLNIGPGPDGEWHAEAYGRLNEIGKWMEKNGQAIFNTKPLAPYRQGKWAFTENEKKQFAFYLPDTAERKLPASITLPYLSVPVGTNIEICGAPERLTWKTIDSGILVTIPAALRQRFIDQPSWVFSIEKVRDTLDQMKEVRIRGGLPNFFAKLNKGDSVRIAYLGGSITAAGGGWRDQSVQWFKSQFPKAIISQVNAGVGGTGSDLGVFRLQRDVLQYKPDLVFVEFAVNDGGAKTVHQSMEGIVRQIWRDNPSTDICFVYTVAGNMLEIVRTGKLWPSMLAMEHIAQHYSIPSIQLGMEAVRLEKEGALIFQGKPEDYPGKLVFTGDNVHPNTHTGHRLYTEALARSMTEMRTLNKPTVHQLRSPYTKDNWEEATMYPVSDVIASGNWVNLTEKNDSIAMRYQNKYPALYKASEPGAALQIRFKGRLLGMSDIIGPNCGQYAVTVDNEQEKLYPRFDRHASYYRANAFFLPLMKDKVHIVIMKVSDKKLDKMAILSKGDGLPGNLKELEENACYAGWLLVLGKLVKK